ncbi:MAG: glycosyltransferase family 1 protein [Chloroflexi bacterium]|nr:glycosyltransferase family 1 protein [Chloroflexota bacterium]
MARVIVAGYIVRFPMGGLVWTHLQYVLGLARLGHQVYFLEESGWPDACYHVARNVMTDDPSYGVDYLARLMERFGLGDRWAFRDQSGRFYGLPREAVDEVIAEAEVLINISGLSWFDGFAHVPSKLFVDENPAFTQIRAAQGDAWLCHLLDSHDLLFSYGCNIGQPGCSLPTTGYEWHPARQPLVMNLWPFTYDPQAERFTTIMSLRPYEPIEYQGQVYGHKDVEFQRFLDLPRHTPQPLEVAVSVSGEQQEALQGAGWHWVDAMDVSRDVDRYRAYIRGSRGEFSIAKNAYVRSRSGWFSDRSASYLACGKPVLLQDTGFGDWLPTGKGLLSFATLEQAVEGLARINADYQAHCRAARRLAEEYFDSDRVLGELLGLAGIR